MLALRPSCELCGKSLPNNSIEAYICSFECTFCYRCVTDILKNVCPNCGGGFEKRPIRPMHHLINYPASTNKITKLLDEENYAELRKRFEGINPEDR